jgi:hypothetical protein
MITDLSVTCPVRYADSAAPPGKFYALEHASSTCRFVARETTIINGRRADKAPTLDRNGLQLVRHSTAVTDFWDEQQVEGTYKPEVAALVKELTGASEVIVFHMLARDEGPAQRAGRRPARNAHIDYTEESYHSWARHLLGGREADRRMRGRWSAVNVWRGMRPVESTPLAVCDAATVTDDDLIDVPIWLRPTEPHTPEVAGRNLVFRPAHRWYYFPLMQLDEALVFRLADSDHTVPRLAAHTAFDDPSTPADAAPRQSFEIRTFAFFD